MKLESRTIHLRLVEESDAKFILDLRLDSRYNQFLSVVNSDIQSQINWIKEYKVSERNGNQFYFIIERNDGISCGTIRVYDLKENSFGWGSWILNEEKTRYSALESAFLVYQFGFEELSFNKSHFEVMKENKKVVSFHEKMGATRIREDMDNLYFEITRSAVENTKRKLFGKIL